MCTKNGKKVFYVLFRAIETTKSVQIISNHNHVYKSLEVFNHFPNSSELIQIIKKTDDKESLKLMKIEIPYSKLF